MIKNSLNRCDPVLSPRTCVICNGPTPRTATDAEIASTVAWGFKIGLAHRSCMVGKLWMAA